MTRMIKPIIWGLSLLILSACTFGSSEPAAVRSTSPSGGSAVSPMPVGSPLPSPSPTTDAFTPAPGRRIPRDPAALARDLVRTTYALRDAIHAWTEDADPSRGGAPENVVLLGLYQQRIYRLLARNENLYDRALPRLGGRLREHAKANITAARELFSIVRPISRPSRFRTGPPKPAGVLLRWFRKAEKRFGVDWELLAAVMYVESKFGRVRSASTAGAQGPMQFIPSTWAAYGMGGDIHDPHDAIMGAANYLHHSGSPTNDRRALFAYNHSAAYVDATLLYAGQMKRDPRNYYGYYSWQVFVLTTSGDRRLTGPGL
jgi:Transglycosylase SLT domain